MTRARTAAAAAARLVQFGLLAVTAPLVLGCASRAMEQEPTRLAESRSSDALVLGSGPAEARLTVLPATRDITPGTTLTERLRALGEGRQLYLTFSDVSVSDAPGIVYNVYLNRPATDVAEGAASAHFVGALSFFNPPRGAAREIALNVTRPLERLQASGALDTDVRVTIAPAGQPTAASPPRIGRIALTAR
jgi:hypothetical protein